MNIRRTPRLPVMDRSSQPSAPRAQDPHSNMTRPSIANPGNQAFLDAMYQRWRQDPTSVEESWRWFFEGFELARSRAPASASPDGAPDAKQYAIIRLIDAYRRLGHILARLDPLSEPPASIPLLELSAFDL